MSSNTPSSVNGFCRRADRYANPINLTFNSKKVYQTTYGGGLTIFTAFVIIIWLAV
jgi:hypothetical protein